MHVYSVTVMTHVIPLEAGQSSQGTSEPITPGPIHHVLPNTGFLMDPYTWLSVWSICPNPSWNIQNRPQWMYKLLELPLVTNLSV